MTTQRSNSVEKTTTINVVSASESCSNLNGATCENSKQPFEKPTTVLPAVVACGYKRINITKSGNSFPAFLIAFEDLERSLTDTHRIGTNRNDIEDEIPSFGGVRFAWRSKKDFLLLARKCSDQGNFQEQQRLPKAALKKIAEESVVPWKISSVLQMVSGTIDQLAVPRKDNETAPMQGDGNHKFMNPITLPSCFCDPRLPNHFSARMKKSIWQIDRFLQSMQNTAGNSEQEQNAWEYFCRHSNTEGLFTRKAFVDSTGHPQAKRNTNTQHSDDRVATEKLDCDRSSSPNMYINKRTEITTNVTTTATATTTTLRESSRLGQYFASKENARKVVECALEKILPLYHRGNTIDEKDCSEKQKILFIEPSCGHGDIVVSLVDALKQHEIPPSGVWIMGYDIDACAIDTCRHRKELLPGPTKASDDSIGGFDNDYPIHWDCKTFFETSREKCIRYFEMPHKNDIQSHTIGTTAYKDGETQLRDRELLVCCLGGPPYTTGPGCGSGIKIDLPERFVDHCFTEWKADVVSFLLPDRYKEGMTSPISGDCSFTKRKQAGAIDQASPTNDHRIKGWSCETHELEASTFFFRGTTKVTQPSIIQVFSGLESVKPLGNS